MYIVNMVGQLLVSFNKWDVRSVPAAERWIKEHGYVIWKCEVIHGEYVVTVRSC